MKATAAPVVALLLAGCTGPPTSPATPTVTPRPATPAQKAPTPAPAPTKPPERGRLTTIGIEQIFALRLKGQVLMVDVRRGIFHQLGHIPGSVHLPLTDFEAALARVKPQLDAAAAGGKAIVLYCQGESCPDSHTTAEALAERGYDVSVYPGGWDEWKAVGVD